MNYQYCERPFIDYHSLLILPLLDVLWRKIYYPFYWTFKGTWMLVISGLYHKRCHLGFCFPPPFPCLSPFDRQTNGTFASFIFHPFLNSLTFFIIFSPLPWLPVRIGASFQDLASFSSAALASLGHLCSVKPRLVLIFLMLLSLFSVPLVFFLLPCPSIFP